MYIVVVGGGGTKKTGIWSGMCKLTIIYNCTAETEPWKVHSLYVVGHILSFGNLFLPQWIRSFLSVLTKVTTGFSLPTTLEWHALLTLLSASSTSFHIFVYSSYGTFLIYLNMFVHGPDVFFFFICHVILPFLGHLKGNFYIFLNSIYKFKRSEDIEHLKVTLKMIQMG